jgi:hypothetical protein
LEVRRSSARSDRGQALAELAQVVHAPCGPDLLPSPKRLERDGTGLLQLSRRQVRIGQDHGSEEIAAQERRVIDGHQ